MGSIEVCFTLSPLHALTICLQYNGLFQRVNWGWGHEISGGKGSKNMWNFQEKTRIGVKLSRVIKKKSRDNMQHPRTSIVQITLAKSRSTKEASYQPAFIGSCLVISHTCFSWVTPEVVSFPSDRLQLGWWVTVN